MEYREQLENIVNQNGGEYRGNLTKDVTHLVAKVPSGNKYNYAIQWDIKVVSVEWLTESQERGMILEESCYNPSLPASERGKGAYIRRSTSTSPLGKRQRAQDMAMENSRKLRRTASAKLNSQNLGLWADIVQADPKVQLMKNNEWDDLKYKPAPEESNLSAVKTENEDADIAQAAVDSKATNAKNVRRRDSAQGVFLGQSSSSMDLMKQR